MLLNDKETVLVDMDGVLCDFDAAVLGGLSPTIPRVKRTNFYIANDYPEFATSVAAVYNDPKFFFELAPIDGAVDGWQRLLGLGYQPRICSAPIRKNLESVNGKIAWIRKYLVPRFGESVVTDAIFDREKHRYPGVALIDDRPDVQAEAAQWSHVVFDQPYNRHVDGQVNRLNGWADPAMPEILASLTR